MTQSKSTPVQGLIEWPLAAVVSELRMVSRTLDGDNETALTEAANRLTRLEAEVGRLRAALEKIEKAPAWGAPDFWQVTPSDVRQLARAALNPQEPTHAD